MYNVPLNSVHRFICIVVNSIVVTVNFLLNLWAKSTRQAVGLISLTSVSVEIKIPVFIYRICESVVIDIWWLNFIWIQNTFRDNTVRVCFFTVSIIDYKLTNLFSFSCKVVLNLSKPCHSIFLSFEKWFISFALVIILQNLKASINLLTNFFILYSCFIFLFPSLQVKFLRIQISCGRSTW